MSFDTDMRDGLLELESECPADATWTPSLSGSSDATVRGVFNQADFLKAFQDAGVQPEYIATLVCDLQQFEAVEFSEIGHPAVDDPIEVNGVSYRIESVATDETAIELRLKNP